MKGEVIFRGVISFLLIVLTGLVGVAAYFAKGQVEEIKQFNREVDNRVATLERENEVSKATAFTINQWMTAKNLLDSNLATQDKRIQRTEDAVVAIKEYLPRMEQKLDQLTKQKQ